MRGAAVYDRRGRRRRDMGYPLGQHSPARRAFPDEANLAAIGRAVDRYAQRGPGPRNRLGAATWLIAPHNVLMPPSMTISLPTLKPPASETRNSTASATSTGRPRRPAGICATRLSMSFSFMPSLPCRGVAIGPALTALTRTPRPINSPDKVRAIDKSPALVAE